MPKVTCLLLCSVPKIPKMLVCLYFVKGLGSSRYRLGLRARCCFV